MPSSSVWIFIKSLVFKRRRAVSVEKGFSVELRVRV